MKYFLLFLLGGSFAWAQGTLKGRVADAAGNEALAHVQVFIASLKLGVYSDADGQYRISSLPRGTFQVQFSRIGYKTQIRSVTIAEAETGVDVALTVSPIESEGILVTAPYASVAEETAYNAEALPRSAFKPGALTLTESMARVPGVHQLTTGGNIGKPVIRGLYGNRVLTVVNGFRFDNQQWQDEHGLGLSDVGVENVEIVKGPASLIYGTDAMGGVVHVLPERPAAVGSRESDLSFGIASSNGAVRTEYGLKSATEERNWKIRVGGISAADYVDGAFKRVPNTRLKGGDVKTGVGFNKPWGVSSWNYELSYYVFGVVEQEAVGRKDKEKRSLLSRGSKEAHHNIFYNLFTTQNLFFVGDSRFGLDAGVHLNNRSEIEGEEEKDIGDMTLQLNTYTANLKYYSPKFANSELIAGTEATLQTNSNRGDRRLIPNAGTRELSAFGYLKHRLGKLVIEEGVRANQYHVKTRTYGDVDSMGYFKALSRNYNTFNGSLGFAYAMSESFLFKANAASGYRAPNLAELSSNGLHEGTLNYELGDPKLKSEQNLELDASAEFHTGEAVVKASAFNNRFQDFIYLDPSTDTTAQGYRIYYFRQTDATFNGGELSVDWSLSRSFGYRGSFSTVIAKRNSGGYLPYIPANQMDHELTYRFGAWKFLNEGYSRIEARTAFRQNRTASAEHETPAYTVINLAVGGKTRFLSRPAEVTLAVDNLLNKKYFDHMSRIKPGAFSQKTGGFNNMGFNVYLSLRLILS